MPAMIPTIVSGTLTRKTDPHQNLSSRSPPRIGPSATPTPENAAWIEIAVPRSSGGKITARIESAGAKRRPAPVPMTPRITISCRGEWASAPNSDPIPKTPKPIRNTPLRP
jgi:hypothetical protein